MIIQNGTIETRTAAQGGTDPGTGYPVNPAETPWGPPIPCQYSADKYDRLGKADGERATVASYSILIEEQPMDERAQLRLKDMALGMLAKLELYALECYNVTARHLAAVDKLETVDEVAGYDYTDGYPEMPRFDIQ